MNDLIRTFNDSKLAPIIVVKNSTNTSRTIPTTGAFIFYLPSRNPTYPTNSNSNFLFRFVKSTSLARYSKFCLKNKFPTGSQLFVSYNYLHNIPTWIILSPRSSICTHRNVNFCWINYSCPTDTSTTITVPTIYLLLQLPFKVFKRSSLSRTKVPHQVIRDLLSSESFSSESAFRNSKSLIPTTGYMYFFFSSIENAYVNIPTMD